MSYIYLNKKTELKLLKIFNKNSSLPKLTILVLLCINVTKNLIIQSTDFLVQSAIPKFRLQTNANLSFESFYCGIKCNINNLFTNIISAFSRCPHIQEGFKGV